MQKTNVQQHTLSSDQLDSVVKEDWAKLVENFQSSPPPLSEEIAAYLAQNGVDAEDWWVDWTWRVHVDGRVTVLPCLEWSHESLSWKEEEGLEKLCLVWEQTHAVETGMLREELMPYLPKTANKAVGSIDMGDLYDPLCVSPGFLWGYQSVVRKFRQRLLKELSRDLGG